ncbi:tigger transposable element-derived protein 6-like [Ostrea edulis]|uniref:tigger transposable element-derived protein 6-like n=1 Tax=Ostrea edulis TaxID=37623 RepID=UPI0020948420|nr:tigger transposable element-derived protein 6-like [Ostrea edulis]
MSLKRKRTDLTLATKYEIYKLLDQKVSQSEIGRRYGLVQSTISTISKNHTKIKENYESSGNSERKRHRSGKNAQLDDALKEWFQTARQRDIPISGPILQEKAINFAKRMNVSDFNARVHLAPKVFSRSWDPVHGEKKDADKDSADRWITDVLPELTREYSADDIYNADETGIYYRAIPDSTHVFKNEIASGSKKCKDRVTALVCANMSGDDKRKLLIIGKS